MITRRDTESGELLRQMHQQLEAKRDEWRARKLEAVAIVNECDANLVRTEGVMQALSDAWHGAIPEAPAIGEQP